MPFDAKGYYDLAAVLAGDGRYQVPARCRTALGRLYYSVLLEVRRAVRTAQKRSIDEAFPSHGEVASVLACEKGALATIGGTLNSLYTARRKSDYELDPGELFWVKNLNNPSFVLSQAKLADDAIRLARTSDFTPVLGKL